VNEEQKRHVKERYVLAKQKGVKFYPDIVYKDLLVSFAIFLLLVGLATFIGVANDPKADPNDASYIPRPEWYFLFLFEMLKFIPGSIEWVGTTIIPAIAILSLLLLPFIDKNPARFWKKRITALSIMSIVVFLIGGLTIRAVLTTPSQPESALASTLQEKYALGEELYNINCVECHGTEGEGGEVIGVAGLEGVTIKAISSEDVLFTRTDDTFYNIIDYGQPNLMMPPFGKGYKGELTPVEMESIVTYMRYVWDARMALPKEAQTASTIPTLKEGDVAVYDVHVEPIVKRYCISCHRPGKTNNNYIMQSYTETMTSGDHAPNVIQGDLNSNLIRMLHREEIEAGGAMPPTKPLPTELIKIFENWVLNQALQTVQ